MAHLVILQEAHLLPEVLRKLNIFSVEVLLQEAHLVQWVLLLEVRHLLEVRLLREVLLEVRLLREVIFQEARLSLWRVICSVILLEALRLAICSAMHMLSLPLQVEVDLLLLQVEVDLLLLRVEVDLLLLRVEVDLPRLQVEVDLPRLRVEMDLLPLRICQSLLLEECLPLLLQDEVVLLLLMVCLALLIKVLHQLVPQWQAHNPCKILVQWAVCREWV